MFRRAQLPMITRLPMLIAAIRRMIANTFDASISIQSPNERRGRNCFNHLRLRSGTYYELTREPLSVTVPVPGNRYPVTDRR